jgi:hypothetical protein
VPSCGVRQLFLTFCVSSVPLCSFYDDT